MGTTQIENFYEQDAEKNIWAKERGRKRRKQKTAYNLNYVTCNLCLILLRDR
jgi:hypothetical protein